MKSLRSFFAVVLIGILIPSLWSDGSAWGIGDAPHLGLRNADRLMYSPLSGELITVEDAGDGFFTLVIQTEYRYWFTDSIEKESVIYHLVIEGIRVPAVGSGDVTEGTILGFSTDRTRISAVCDDVDPAFLRYTSSRPIKRDNRWWFKPDWIIPTTSQQFTFRPVSSMESLAAGYFDRALATENEDSENPKSIRLHDDSLDRVRLVTRLDSYPVDTEANSIISELENYYYQNSDLFVAKSIVSRDGYDIALWWQPKFEEWLKEEYLLGDELWLYFSFYALDLENLEIVAFVRDFSDSNPIDVVNHRLEDLGGE